MFHLQLFQNIVYICIVQCIPLACLLTNNLYLLLLSILPPLSPLVTTRSLSVSVSLLLSRYVH